MGYETSWKVSPLNRAVWPIKGRILWEGQKDKKVLLWKEQGIGDDILFMGLVSEAAKVASSTIVYTRSTAWCLYVRDQCLGYNVFSI